ncbi:MAG: hypothetical protein ACKO34_06975 [Vampirovibrionales bacterium]
MKSNTTQELFNAIREASIRYDKDCNIGNYEVVFSYGNSMDQGTMFRCYMRQAFEELATLPGWSMQHDPYHSKAKDCDVRRLLSHESMPNVYFILLRKNARQTPYYLQACKNNLQPEQLLLFPSEPIDNPHSMLICVHTEPNREPTFWAWDNNGKKQMLTVSSVCTLVESTVLVNEIDISLKPTLDDLDIKLKLA